MAINVNIIPILKQVIGETYLFELISVSSELESNTVGCIVVNRKTDACNMTLPSFLNKENDKMVKDVIEQIKKTVINMDEVID